MVLESTIICIDNSEWMRNGDYAPSRFQAQADAVNLICGAKTQSNPENTVGILTMGGKGVRVLVAPTSDLGKILGSFHGLEIGGNMNMTAGIQVAQLALKHRQNKNQQQRIIVFAGSPVEYDKKALEGLGKKLKKNSVALDIVDFGEEEDGKPEKLEALIASANNNDSSHIVHIPPGSNALSDVLISTPIFTGDAGGGSAFAAAAAAATAGGGGGMSGFEFGVDPNVDPELALALRMSMEEERARQEAAAKKASDDAANQEKASSFQDATASDTIGDESAVLQEAVAMSLDKPDAAHSSGIATVDTDMTDVIDEDLELALQMSMQGTVEDSSRQLEMNKLLGDQSFISSIIASLPGVDPNDPSLKDLLTTLPGQSEDKKSEDGGDGKEDKQ